MSGKNELYSAIVICLGLVGGLILLGCITSLQAVETVSEPKTSSPSFGLPRQSLNLISLFPVAADGQTVAMVAVYDDPSTSRAEDYLEFYNRDGELVAVGWFDQFGIQRLAVDRAFVDGADRLQGVFVTVVEGESI